MKTIDIVYLVLMVLLVVFSFCYSAMDMAYGTVSQTRLEARAKEGDKRSKKALKYAQNYDKSIATILFGNDFSNVLLSSLGALVGRDLLEPYIGDAYSTVTSLILLVVLLLFGEFTPKQIAKEHSFAVTRFFVPLLDVVSVLFFPFVYPSNKLAVWLVKPIASRRKNNESPLASDEELEAMVNTIEQEGIIDEDQSELLHRSIDFKETSCYEVMTPRVNVYGYDTDGPFSEFLKRKDAFKHSRIIVYQGNFDHVLGYIPVKTLLRELVKGKNVSYQDVLVPIVNVPRTMMISSAMALMKQTKHHIAIVRDEYGGMEGIVTMEDILEELVGEMWDEKDNPHHDIRKASRRNCYYVTGDENIDDLYNFLGLDPDKLLPDDYTTVSGWIVDHLGRFAVVGDSFRTDQIEVTVLRCDAFTVKEAYVKVLKKKDAH